jgi:NAD(P)-dependent dehydrogenase (short-subunit alcohol dehydrogenase family)
MDDAGWNASFAATSTGVFYGMRSCAAAMTAGGSIVNIASISGIVGSMGRAAYGASKGGVITLSHVMAVDLAPFNIRVNVLAPGPVATPLVEQVHTDEARAQYAARVPLRRYGRPEEMAAVAAFLCSDDASYVTGHVLAADGGFLGAGIIPSPG